MLSIAYNDIVDTDSCQLTLLHVCLIQQELSMWGQLQSSLHHMVIATLVWLQWTLVELHPQQSQLCTTVQISIPLTSMLE